MKSFLFLTAFLFISITAFSQTGISGTWLGKRPNQNGELMELKYKFEVTGNELKGSISSSFGELPIQDGKVDGNKFYYKISLNDNTVESTGELTAQDEIVLKNQFGEIKLTRIKE